MLSVWLLPYIRPVDARRFLYDVQIGDDYTSAVRAVLDRCGVDCCQRNVLIAHQFVTAGSMRPERASEEFALGGVDNVDVGAFSDFDYVALGHIHRPQHIGRNSMRYAGSLLKYSIGEARFDKSAVLVDVGPKSAGSGIGECVRFETVPLIPLHEMREIKGHLDVLDNYTGKERDASSLSGGESFEASLCLALGLSDVVQSNAHGIQLDAMFIDEGFGSLDQESLGKAISILVDLTCGSKLIGIISHVEELKASIDKRIVIERDRSGSKLRIEA